jgi:hypothetical protein
MFQPQKAFDFMMTSAVALYEDPLLAYSPTYPFLPLVEKHISGANVSRYVAAGYDPNDVQAYLNAAWASINHAHIMVDLK